VTVFGAVLIANRGEIAVRITRTLRRLGVRSVAIYTEADEGARHAREADLALRVKSYLAAGDILEVAHEAGAEAVHPGYGFLAESADFARACERRGLVFIGPPPEAIARMGDKIEAKQAVAAAGVPVVPGRDERGLSDEQIARAAMDVGLGSGTAVMLKPSAGGGGKGMRLVQEASELSEAIAAARREALAAFGDDTLFVERYISHPRHIEIQVFADSHGNVVHLGERECSLQRRHQKIIEEAPSPLLGSTEWGARTRAAMGIHAIAVAGAVGYVGAGTVEYIVSADSPESYYFMEMNTRLQVEHAVTEMACTVGGNSAPDLVELQLRVAAGERLPFSQAAVAFAGHAIEARVYAEDPARGFLPTGGTVLALAEPDLPDVRVDSGLSEGVTIGGAYDPMLAKVIAWGPDRVTAVHRLDRALARYTVLGVTTNLAFLRGLLANPEVAAGRLDTGLAERAAAVAQWPAVPPAVLTAAALDRLISLEDLGGGPWAIPDGWRLAGPAWTTWRFGDHEVRVRGRASAAQVSVDGGDPVDVAGHRYGTGLLVSYAGRLARFSCAREGDTCWLGHDGQVWALREAAPLGRAMGAAAGSDGIVRSPMPGTVLSVKVAMGEHIVAGQALLVVEAMKMEHVVTAPTDGVITQLPAQPGVQAALDQVLAVVTQAEEVPDAGTTGRPSPAGDDL
jgi:acetyl-CoA/propionyl-CoA carboxylase, biotin carboxylase, biotin carboxyl carrier protein